ncbi:MAG: type III secretion T3S chaperone, partial [Chlamydiota bacterium]
MNKYPLEQLALIKQRKLDEAEKLLKERKALLAKEEERLRSVELERNKVKTHKIAKLTQLRNELDSGSTSDKIQQMKEYL